MLTIIYLTFSNGLRVIFLPSLFFQPERPFHSLTDISLHELNTQLLQWSAQTSENLPIAAYAINTAPIPLTLFYFPSKHWPEATDGSSYMTLVMNEKGHFRLGKYERPQIWLWTSWEKTEELWFSAWSFFCHKHILLAKRRKFVSIRNSLLSFNSDLDSISQHAMCIWITWGDLAKTLTSLQWIWSEVGESAFPARPQILPMLPTLPGHRSLLELQDSRSS